MECSDRNRTFATNAADLKCGTGQQQVTCRLKHDSRVTYTCAAQESDPVQHGFASRSTGRATNVSK